MTWGGGGAQQAGSLRVRALEELAIGGTRESQPDTCGVWES